MLICVFKIISRKVIDKAKFEFLFWVFKGFSHLVVIKWDTEWVVAHIVRIASRNITDGHSWKEEEDAEEKIPRVWREHLSHLVMTMIMIIMMIDLIFWGYIPHLFHLHLEKGKGEEIPAGLWPLSDLKGLIRALIPAFTTPARASPPWRECSLPAGWL